jgi:hypothetical protein
VLREAGRPRRHRVDGSRAGRRRARRPTPGHGGAGPHP